MTEIAMSNTELHLCIYYAIIIWMCAPPQMQYILRKHNINIHIQEQLVKCLKWNHTMPAESLIQI